MLERLQMKRCEKTVNVPSNIAKSHPSAMVLEVEGNCMNRVIPEGSHVLLDPTITPSNGSIVVVETEDYQAIMRRWYKGSKSLMLVADSYEEFEELSLLRYSVPSCGFRQLKN